jgi:ubiquinone/menaquinone biosynthesis C-methylase UbiE
MRARDERSERQPLGAIVGRYDRVARFYSTLEPLYLIFPSARRRAVAALGLKLGDVVLEIGAGSGRNLPYLVEAIGSRGTVVAVDASAGMLAEARRLVKRRGWPNVELFQHDAAKLDVDRDLDAVLFSLSYSVLPDPRPALARAWKGLRPGSRLVVMDAGLPDNLFGRMLGPIAHLLVKLAPGDPYSDPWSDLASYAPVKTERFLLGIFYVCTIERAAET